MRKWIRDSLMVVLPLGTMLLFGVVLMFRAGRQAQASLEGAVTHSLERLYENVNASSPRVKPLPVVFLATNQLHDLLLDENGDMQFVPSFVRATDVLVAPESGVFGSNEIICAVRMQSAKHLVLRGDGEVSRIEDSELSSWRLSPLEPPLLKK